MEVSLGLVLSLVSVALVVTLLLRVLNSVLLIPLKLEHRLRAQGLCGTPYTQVPGELKENYTKFLERSTSPIHFSDDFVTRVLPLIPDSIDKHGKESFTWLGLTPTVLAMKPDQIKHVLSNIYDFQKPIAKANTKYVSPGLFSLDGEKWMLHRKIINPAFHQEKLKHMLPAFYLSCHEIITKLERELSDMSSCELDVWPYIQMLTSDVISRTAFGSSYEEGRKIFQLIKEQAELVMKAMQGIQIPGWWLIPTKLNRRMKQVDRETTSLLNKIVSKRVKLMEAGEAPNDDLLGLMMEANAEEKKLSNGKISGLKIEDIIEECKLFYFVGQDTTSSLLIWTIVMLGKHQDWQARAREEVLQVFGKEKPDFEKLGRLKIVNMILNEVLRLFPPIVVLLRSVHKDTELCGLSLPSGTQVALPVISIHHDKQLWGEDAKEFNPERFSEGIFKATNGQASYFPFGSGPRICVGQNYSLMEARLALAMILQNFAFELSPTYTHAPMLLLTIQPQYGAHIIIRRT